MTEKSHKLKNFLFVLFIVIGIGGLTYFGIETWSKQNEIPNPLTTITKTPPTINGTSTTLTTIDISVTANDNYQYVTITIKLITSSEDIYAQHDITKNNMIKNATYIFTHEMTVNELLYTSKFSYKITAYK